MNGGTDLKIGYIRVSTEEQNTARQEVLLRELGVDEVFIDKASGKNADRPELTRMMNYVRRGDTVIVESISRFARNTRDLLDLVEQLTEKQVEFVSRKELSTRLRLPANSCSLSLQQSRSLNASISCSVSVRHRDCQKARQVHRPQTAALAGQLRASGCSLACRGNHCRRSHAADRTEGKHILPQVLPDFSCA